MQSEQQPKSHSIGSAQWVIKLSKLCNLRCQYCYEFESLSDPSRLSTSDLNLLFRRVAEYSSEQRIRADFVWHGGEPLLMGPEYFDELFAIQSRCFAAARASFTNSIQTNLYQLKEPALELLQRFDSIGVSLDLFGDMRVNINGALSQKRVLENMEVLKGRGIRFGCICVLSRPVKDRIDQVFDFFSQAKIGFRLLPIYRTAFEGQHDRWGLTESEVSETFIRVFDRMIKEAPGITIAPIDDYLSTVVRRHLGKLAPSAYANGKTYEMLFIVDTDGQTYSSADAYSPKHAYGSILESSVSELLVSDGYKKSLHERLGRLQDCQHCEFNQNCSGKFLGEATPEQRHDDGKGSLICPSAYALHRHIDQWLKSSELIDPASDLLDVESLAEFLP